MQRQEMTPLELHHKGQRIRHIGKGATEQILPSRHAMTTLVHGDPYQRSIQNYAKSTPMMNPLAEPDF